MLKVRLLYLLLIFGKSTLFATTWLIGPSRADTVPSQVSGLVQDGDTVLIDAGTYNSDVTQWNANNLLLKGTGGGFAHLQANGLSYDGKAIWVINGNNTVVDSVEFSLCTCVDSNGAGIREQGTNLTIRHCYFHDNQDGILTDADTGSDILIEYTEFYNNGAGNGYSHNLYVGQVRSLTFQYNYSHHAVVGHELKSRAINNYILYNRFAEDSTGTASRSLDLPNGGLAIVIGNELEKGPLSQNSDFMEFGLEGLVNPGSQQLYVVNNTFVDDRYTEGSFIDLQKGVALCKAYNNIFAGDITSIIYDSTTIDTSNNFYTTPGSAGLVNPADYDYYLLPTSPAINGASPAGNAGSFSLTPVYEYLQPLSMVPRLSDKDIGAHEYGNPLNSVQQISAAPVMQVYPNPSNGVFTVDVSALQPGLTKLQLFDTTGRLVAEKAGIGGDKVFFDNFNWSAGAYVLSAVGTNQPLSKIIICLN